jgi:hypothetical protein
MLIKNPLSSKYPVALLQLSNIGTIDGSIFIEDSEGQRIVLKDIPRGVEPPSVNMLNLISHESLIEQVILVRFYNDMDSKRLYAKPLSIIQNDSIIRLAF